MSGEMQSLRDYYGVPAKRGTQQVASQEYHDAHLAFARTEIVKAAFERRPILGLLHAYTEDVRQAERDRNA
jgi:hypothetical protein